MEKQVSSSNQSKQTSAVVVPVPAVVIPETDTQDHDAWYLVPMTDPEPEVASAWQIKNSARVSDDNILTVLPLQILQARSKVYILCRKPQKGKYGGNLRPAQPITSELEGVRFHEHVPADVLAEDMQAYGPVLVSDHWSKGGRHYESRLVRSTFLSALGELASPWAFAWEDGNTCKDGNLPMKLCLRFA